MKKRNLANEQGALKVHIRRNRESPYISKAVSSIPDVNYWA